MVYSTTPKPHVPGIATSRDAANSIVSRLIMQTVNNVLEQQGRDAGLPDAVISAMLNQLTVRVSYDALECKTVAIDKPLDMSKATVANAETNSDPKGPDERT
ncbi:hypothetical protein KIN20_003820 [Parelaphostrongylus tenuis]|uniref:Uncharacterized protein n=1 Tax=Parelaphostrongylus tenuis TaxID=148309 RepID=A0AAD5QHM2_PARTN|nr:hypothetical protein KIN20_003820 [Parelaphostrongylus tenuis]